MRISTIALATLAAGGLFTAALNLMTATTAPSYQPRKSMEFEKAIGRYEFILEHAKLMKGDPLTGKIEAKAVMASRKSLEMALSKKAGDPLGLVWVGLGPDNVGGRTRAIMIDKTDPNVYLAGGVSGGVYISFNGGNTWSPKIGGTNHLIGAIGQAANGYIYIGTGPGHDGAANGRSDESNNTLGDGLYRIKDIYAEYEHIVDVEIAGAAWTRINQIVTHPTNGDLIFVATNSGLFSSKNASSNAPTFEKVAGIQTAAIGDVDISPDGNTLIACQDGRVWRSTDGGNNFSLSIDLGTGAARVECDISDTDGNYAYLSVANGNSCLYGIYQSSDGGATWYPIANGGGGNTATFDPFANPGVNCQGNYDNAIAVFPNDPGKIIIGGVQLWMGKQKPGSNPPVFGWSQIAITNGGPSTPVSSYVHADKHRILIPSANNIIIGSDGGIAKSNDGGVTWTQNNFGYRVTQFYSLAILPQFGGPDLVMGGTQDNGTLLIGTSTNSPTQAIEVQGGDGFDCDFSAIGALTFSSSQNGNVSRFDAESFTGSSFWDDELEALCGGNNDCGPFYTTLEYWETANAEVTYDSVLFFPPANVKSGDTVVYPSATGGFPIAGIVPFDVNAGDSVLMPDRVQSKFAFANVPVEGSTIFMTRDASNLSIGVPDWSMVAGPNSYPDAFSASTFTMEFTVDGDHLFVGTTDGELYRISNLTYAHDSMTMDVRSPACVITCTRIANPGGVITGISSDPKDPENLIVTIGGYNNPQAVRRINNAVSALSGGANMVNIQGDLPQIPVFECEIDENDRNIVLIGTEYGVWATRNAFASNPSGVEWTDENIGVPRIPVYEIKQQRSPIGFNVFTDDFGPATNYRTYYLGTHGGGFFKTESLVGIRDIEGSKPVFKTNLKIYPNPVNVNSYLEFDLPAKTASRVVIYNLKGQVVKDMNLGTLNAGKQKIRLDASSLNAGTYILSLQAGEHSDVAKFIKAE